ncbi:MAG: sugar phosphate isomerase/epimerase [Planctomycetota bacterium]
MKIGCQINTWGKLDIPSILEEVAKAGYEGFEAAAQKIVEYMDDPAEFKKMLEGYDLVLSSVYLSGKWHDPAERVNVLRTCQKTSAFAEAMGCAKIILGGGTMDPGDDMHTVLQETAARYNECGQIANSYNLKACVHPHAHENATVASPMQIAEIMDLADPRYVFLCPDVGGHIVKGGGHAVEVFRLYGERVQYVHFKDIDYNGKWCLLGEGTTDYPAIVDHLKHRDYGGWLIAEEECKEKIEELGPTECATRNCRYMKALLA